MSIRAQLLGLVALLAALIALPQAAMAHAGHAHGLHVHHTAPETTAPAVHVADMVVEPSLSAGTPHSSSDPQNIPCDRGCCAQGSCASCVSLVAPIAPLVDPPSLRTLIGLAPNPLGSGIDMPSLRRPPRSLT